MDPKALVPIFKNVFDYLLAALLILALAKSIGVIPDILINLVWLAPATAVVGAVGYSSELLNRLRGR